MQIGVRISLDMDRAAIVFCLPLTVMFLALFPLAESHWPQPLHHPHPRPRHIPLPIPQSPPPPISAPPLCSSQFSLVNDACSKVHDAPIHPRFPTIFASSDEPYEGRLRSMHHHSHSHSHRHRHRQPGTPEEEDCCRWLREVDNVCVCDLLVRLPPFLTVPIHNYTVKVDEACEVTFSCG